MYRYLSIFHRVRNWISVLKIQNYNLGSTISVFLHIQSHKALCNCAINYYTFIFVGVEMA